MPQRLLLHPIRRRRHASRWAAPAAISALALFAGVSTAIDGALVGPLLRQGMKHVFDQPVGGSVALSAAISVFAGRRALRALAPAWPRTRIRRAAPGQRHRRAA